MRLALIISLILLPLYAIAGETIPNHIIQKSKKGVVSIENNVHLSAYSSNRKFNASGFLVDKTNGIILTNKHVAKKSQINDLTVTFFNGRELGAKFLYNDPWHDFAFVKVNPKELPEGTVELQFADNTPKNEDPVLIIGNNQGQNFSIQTGIVSSKYESIGLFPNQAYRISLNTRGGSSGAPILNKEGQIIALNFAGDDTYAYGLKINYPKDTLEYIKNDTTPPRRSTGALLQFYSLDKATKYLGFPKDIANNYIKEHPDSFNRAIQVKSILRGTPAEGLLYPGDIILYVNDKNIGPHLYELQAIQNNKNQKVKFTIIRDGKKKDVSVGLYDLYDPEIKRILVFGGAVFYETNDVISLLTGTQKGSLFVTNINEGSPFQVFPALNPNDRAPFHIVKINKIANKTVNSINDLVAIIPELVKRKNFTVNFQNFGYYVGFNNLPFFDRMEEIADVTYYSYGSEPTILTYDENKKEWTSEKIIK